MAQSHRRIYTFDLLRGIAVLAMILAHSVYFFYNRDGDFLLSLEGFGNTVSFVTFLLVSGAVVSVAYASGHQTDGKIKRKRVLTRVFLLLLAYYLLALFLTGANIWRAEGFARISLILDILSFRHLPGFTEYFPPFIFYSALLVAVPNLFLSASRTLSRVILASTVSLLAGWALYHVPVGSVAQPWVALLAGAKGLYRFPLLQYLPVFLFGLYWGHRTLMDESLRAKGMLCFRLFCFFALVVAAAWLGSHLFGWPLADTFSRWPPSIPFLSLGLGFAFFIASLLYALRQLRHVALLRDLLLLFGQNALGLFWSHIFLLGLYALAGGPHVSSVGVFIFLFLFLILLALALTTFLPFNFRLALTRARGSHEERDEAVTEEAVFRLSKDVATEAAVTTKEVRHYFFPERQRGRRILKKRHRLAILLVAFAAAVMVFPATIQEIALQRQQRDAGVWWSDTYAYRQQVTLHNTDSFVTIQSGAPVAMQFNHKQLVAEGKSRADGQDVKLVYWTGEKHLVADSYLDNPDREDATLKFKAPVAIQAGRRDQFYYLYYGGFVTSPTNDFSLDTKDTALADFGGEEVFPLVASVSKTWNLIGQANGDTMSIHLTTARRNELQTVTYQVLDTSLTGSMVRSADTSWEAIIPVATLRPGAYRVQATLHDGQKIQTSQVTGFYRSQPLYVAWTIDWEGYDVNRSYLDAMEAIANEYDLPMTHFFNPRIYVTKTISAQRAKTLTEWVKRRLDLGDAFGLHLHMFTDFVEQAGVKSRLDPNWGDAGTGYGVPIDGYTKDEQERLILNASDLLVANGFRRPDLFRAGGWYANVDTLTALEDLGFSVDSSARTKYQFGKNRLPGSWDILPTTRPYQPSRTNQNRSSDSNHFAVLEIPDNGADSYAYSAQAMIDRFTANTGNGILSSKQQLTYLSHPHWFDDKEQARVRELFTYISRYTFANDRGPVILTTTDNIANIWSNGQ